MVDTLSNVRACVCVCVRKIFEKQASNINGLYSILSNIHIRLRRECIIKIVSRHGPTNVQKLRCQRWPIKE